MGTPIDIVKAYYDTIDNQHLIKAIQIKKIIRYTCITLSTFALCISLWIIHIYNQADNDFQTAVLDNYYEVLEDIAYNEKNIITTITFYICILRYFPCSS